MFNNGLAPIHPGEYLSEMLEELNVSQASFARTIDECQSSCGVADGA